MGAAMIDSSPIVIFGAPRSGTTYLNNVLNQHPAVFVSHEMRLFAWLHECLNVLPRQDRLLVTYKDAFLRHLRRSLPEMVRGFYASMWPHVRHWGDKNPHYADPMNKGCLNTIVELFPEAKFIHMLRDGRDVVSSLVRKQHDDGRPWADAIKAPEVWVSHVSNSREFAAAIPPAQFIEVRYERLVREDLAVAREVFDFLGIEFHARVEAFCTKEHESRTPFSGPTRDLTGDVAGSDWSTLFTPRQQLDILNVIGPNLVKMEYETESSLQQALDVLRRRVDE